MVLFIGYGKGHIYSLRDDKCKYSVIGYGRVHNYTCSCQDEM